jgi:ABC-type uncharacterized transport system permease subunit
MVRSFQLAWMSIRLGFLNALQYRTDFWIAMVQSLIGLATSLAALAVVYGQTGDLGGWQRDELVALIGVFMIVAGLLGLVVRPSLERLMEGIRLGTLDFDLLKPVDAQLMVSVRQVEVWRTIDIVLGTRSSRSASASGSSARRCSSCSSSPASRSCTASCSCWRRSRSGWCGSRTSW